MTWPGAISTCATPSHASCATSWAGWRSVVDGAKACGVPTTVALDASDREGKGEGEKGLSCLPRADRATARSP